MSRILFVATLSLLLLASNCQQQQQHQPCDIPELTIISAPIPPNGDNNPPQQQQAQGFAPLPPYSTGLPSFIPTPNSFNAPAPSLQTVEGNPGYSNWQTSSNSFNFPQFPPLDTNQQQPCNFEQPQFSTLSQQQTEYNNLQIPNQNVFPFPQQPSNPSLFNAPPGFTDLTNPSSTSNFPSQPSRSFPVSSESSSQAFSESNCFNAYPSPSIPQHFQTCSSALTELSTFPTNSQNQPQPCFSTASFQPPPEWSNSGIPYLSPDFFSTLPHAAPQNLQPPSLYPPSTTNSNSFSSPQSPPDAMQSPGECSSSFPIPQWPFQFPEKSTASSPVTQWPFLFPDKSSTCSNNPPPQWPFLSSDKSSPCSNAGQPAPFPGSSGFSQPQWPYLFPEQSTSSSNNPLRFAQQFAQPTSSPCSSCLSSPHWSSLSPDQPTASSNNPQLAPYAPSVEPPAQNFPGISQQFPPQAFNPQPNNYPLNFQGPNNFCAPNQLFPSPSAPHAPATELAPYSS